MDKLTKIEKERGVSLPNIYRSFYNQCAVMVPAKLVGTDLLHNARFDLTEEAIKLLEEDGTANFLQSNDFVFMMHQGYIFWYFKANGDADPLVYGYYEGKMKLDSCGRFSEFIKEF